MTAACTGCGKTLSFDDGRFAGRESVKVRCPACKTVVTLVRPRAAKPPAPKPAPAPPPSKPAAQEAPPRSSSGSPTMKVKREALLVNEDIVEEIPPLPKDRRVSLAILTGNNAGKVLSCSKSRVVLGREGADIPVDDDEVSRRHALLEIHEDLYVLKDLGSTNGTFVDERRISEMEIHDRGEFRIGSTQFMLIVTPNEAL